MNKLAIVKGGGVSTKDVHEFRQNHCIRIAFAEPLCKVGGALHVTCDVWRVTCDVWRVTHMQEESMGEKLQKVGGGSALQLRIVG
jgi:hypothetical protein